MPTVAAHLKKLPAPRRREITRVREVILDNLPEGYEEAVDGALLAYRVPLEVYPDTYNKKPLWYAGLGARKSYCTLHLLPIYGGGPLAKKLEAGFRKAGKKLDMGKACIRFHKADDLELDVIGEIVAAIPMERWIAMAKKVRA